ncbi:hypothetical protein SIID45300_02185 [Candidatus Magnetaquicoccaceae bacterium FCR-1]|uniref:Nucleoside transporter/FeoB GTPase Gate domain-containing protein n=1 Tax=Candidatus Magnetaquiglobus chichijimensis TaxID=3141448 RepID=A0ABQ0CAE1_9PROT
MLQYQIKRYANHFEVSFPDELPTLTKAMSARVAFAFMVFTLLYSPCLATIAAIRREAGSWGWAGFSVLFSLSIAWSLAFLVVSFGRLFS